MFQKQINNILIIDDDEVDRIRLKRLLKECVELKNVQIDERVDKISGLLAIQSRSYDLVLLDFQLPDGDGLELLQEITDSGCPPIPIIIQTVVDEETAGISCVEAGAQHYLVKGRFTSRDLFYSIRYANVRHMLLLKQHQTALDLKDALARVKTLEGALTICTDCKSVRVDTEQWRRIDHYIEENSSTQFSHGYCPDCFEKVKEKIKSNRRQVEAQ